MSANYRNRANFGGQPVQFTLRDAERIAEAVRQNETRRRPRKGSVLPRAAGGGAGPDSITVKVSQNWPTLAHTPLEAGQGLAVPWWTFANGLTTTLETEVPQDKIAGVGPEYTRVANENDIPAYSASRPVVTMPSTASEAGTSSARCGVIRSVSEEPVDGYWECDVQVRGLVRCRVLMLTAGNCVVPPVPYPQKQSIRQYWRRYLTVSAYGYASLLGTGACYQLNGNQYPFVLEASVLLG